MTYTQVQVVRLAVETIVLAEIMAVMLIGFLMGARARRAVPALTWKLTGTAHLLAYGALAYLGGMFVAAYYWGPAASILGVFLPVAAVVYLISLWVYLHRLPLARSLHESLGYYLESWYSHD
jgi:hypothetical protein